MLHVPFRKLVADPAGSRSGFRNLASLAESIDSQGLCEPLGVELIEGTDGEYLVKDGLRRFDAITILVEDGRWTRERSVPVVLLGELLE